MVHLRVGSQELSFPEEEWEAWVSAGKVPADGLVFSLEMTGGLWRRADTLELYHFFRKAGEEERREAALGIKAAMPFVDLPPIAFPRRGFSATGAWRKSRRRARKRRARQAASASPSSAT